MDNPYIDWSLARWREAINRTIENGKTRSEEAYKSLSFKLSPEMKKIQDTLFEKYGEKNITLTDKIFPERNGGYILNSATGKMRPIYHTPLDDNPGILGGTARRSVGWSYDPGPESSLDMNCRCALPPLPGFTAPRIDLKFLQTGIFENPYVYPYTRQQKKESIFNTIKNKHMNDVCKDNSANLSSRSSTNKGMIRPIEILSVDRGFIVKVGCKTLVYENVQNLLTDFTNYLYEPNATEKRLFPNEIL